MHQYFRGKFSFFPSTLSHICFSTTHPFNNVNAMHLRVLNKTRSSLTDTSTFSSVWLVHLYDFAEKDLRFVRDMPSEIAVSRVQAWFVTLKHHVLTYFSCVSQPGNEIWCVETELKCFLKITKCQVFNSQNCCNATFFCEAIPQHFSSCGR